ncbi:MAG: glycosyltransferase family 2 protein [Planctomycetota bacterium]|jgi:glycosyltransferase involved in cell wall biosynthesis
MKTASIVIPTFNRANLLHRAIETSIGQTYPCEVIVCDHGSTDNTPEVVSKYKDKVRYIRREQDKGPIVCWRDGVEQATGEVVHINYDDDWLDLKFMEKTINLMHDDVGFVYSNVLIHYENRDDTRIGFKHPPNIGDTHDIIKYLLAIPGPISPGCAIFRRHDAFKNLLPAIPGAGGIYGNNSGVGEDLLLFLLTALDYPKYAYVPETLAHFLAHSGSITIASGLSVRGQMLLDAYANARKYFLKRSGLPPATIWEDLSHFFRWHYKSHTLTKQIRKKIRMFLRSPIENMSKQINKAFQTKKTG